MADSLTPDEKVFLKNKYLAMGCSEKKAEKKLNLTMKLIVVSALTIVI